MATAASLPATMDTTRGCPGYEKNLQENWNGNVKFGGTPTVPSSIKELCDTVLSSLHRRFVSWDEVIPLHRWQNALVERWCLS
jgi:hypothetical protein